MHVDFPVIVCWCLLIPPTSPKDSLCSVVEPDSQICRHGTHAVWGYGGVEVWGCGVVEHCMCMHSQRTNVHTFKLWQNRYLLITLMLCVHVWLKRSKSSQP